MKSNYLSELSSRRNFIRQAACAAVGTTALSGVLRDLRLINAAVAQSSSYTDYKALVCIFLNGGNDGNNMIIPTSSTDYANYATLRTPVLAIPNAGDFNTTPTNGTYALALKTGAATATNYADADGHTYGFHPAMRELRTLFNSGKCAALLNVGSLVYPLTKAQYSSGSVPVPPQLFSHSDQQVQWQTSIPDQPASTGWGGRIADLYTSSSVNPLGASIVSMAITLAGSNTFQVGTNSQSAQFSVTTGGAVTLSTTSPSATMKTILSGEETLPNLQTAAYSQVLHDAVDIAGILKTSLDAQDTNKNQPQYAWYKNYPSTTITTPNSGSTFGSGLMAQLKMVARLIDISKNAPMGIKRQIFFVQVGGYDNHTLQTNNAGQTTADATKVSTGNHANLLAELSQAMNAFYGAVSSDQFASTPTGTGGLGTGVTAFTVSDFARTFPCNGSGSDHGWGGHHLIVGGAVNGGKIYGRLPVLTVGGPNDTNTGRWIPTTSVDQYAATLASWFGVTAGNLPTIFPNLNRFASSNLGFI